MNIKELDAYNLDDAVKFHDRLNPRLWDNGEQLRPEVRAKLLEIAADFEEFLGLNDVSVKDITISGSNAAYSYTDHSDIDLHLVVDMPTGSGADVYRELFDAKKYQYNDLHNISIGSADVELYVQDADQPHHSQGIYSVKNDQWISVPRRRSADVNDSAVQRKYQDLGSRIENILSSKDHEQLARMMTKIKTMRAAGLEREGEFGVDNIVFKLLRNNGLIQRLVDARSAARDAELSLTERKRKKSRVRYGYGGYWTPGFNFGGTELGGEGGGDGGGGGESVREASTPDGVSASTKMFLEQDAASVGDIVQDFVGYCVDQLGISQAPRLQLLRDPAWSQRTRSFGQFDPGTNRLDISTADRHVMDIVRTVAHELVHYHQQEQQDLPPDAGETGSAYENEANARAGELMRGYGRAHPELFGADAVSESSGYIPTEKERNDPRFKMALSPDVRPGATGKNANRMSLKTGPQGEPTLLIKGLKNALREFKETGRLTPTEDQDLFEIDMSPGNLERLVRNIDARAWIQMVYDRYPQTWQNNHVMPIGPEQFAMFELTPSLSRRDAVEVKWFQAYPLRQGVGSKAMQILQALAREHDISLTLFPWDKGQVSQAKLTKFYRGQGFVPTVKGGKAMAWSPKQPDVAEGKQPGKSVVDAIQEVLPVAQEIWFHGSRATGKHRRNSDTDILVVVPDDLVGDQYLAVVRILQKLSSMFDNYDIQPTKAGNNIHRIAQEEGQLLWSNKPGVTENDLDRFKQYIRPVVKTIPKIEKTTNPAGRTTDHIEWKVTTPTGEIYRYKSKKQAQKHFDSFGQQGVAESLRVDVPNEEWLNNAIEYAKEHSPDRRGLPYMGKTTATVRQVEVAVDRLASLPGMRNEQQNVRPADLAAIMKIMKDTGKLPLDAGTGQEYKPFINVAYDGSAWVNEGNHRIMAANRLDFKTLPVEISYFDGGERVKTGSMYPGKIGL